MVGVQEISLALNLFTTIMVSPGTLMAHYDLEAVRAAARCGAVDFLGRRASFQSSALAEVGVRCAECIASLRAEDFSKTVEYGDGSAAARGALDVYMLDWRVGGDVFPLYIKLKLVTRAGGDRVLLASFHQQEY